MKWFSTKCHGFIKLIDKNIFTSLHLKTMLTFAFNWFYFHFRYNGYLAGYQMSFDTSKSKLTKSNFALGYSQGDFTLHANV